MLTEDDVVDAVCSFLDASGYRILQRCKTTQKGYDSVRRRAALRKRFGAKQWRKLKGWRRFVLQAAVFTVRRFTGMRPTAW